MTRNRLHVLPFRLHLLPSKVFSGLERFGSACCFSDAHEGRDLHDERIEAFLVSKFLEVDEEKAEFLIKEIKTITERQGQRIADSLDCGFRISSSLELTASPHAAYEAMERWRPSQR